MSGVLSRRHLVLGLMAGTAGCASTIRQSPYWGTIAAAIKGTGANPGVSREHSDSLPYANIAAWFDGGAPALLVLGGVEPDGTLNWYGADHKSISTSGPMVTRVIGFDVELRDVRFGAGWSVDIRSMVGGKYERSMSYQADRRVELLMKSEFKRGEAKDIAIFGRTYPVIEVEERVSSSGRYRFTNRYWVDPKSGFCRKSIQRVIPTEANLNIEVLKPFVPA